MLPSRLYQVQTGIANPAGGLAVTFPAPPPGRWWTASVVAAAAPPTSSWAAALGVYTGFPGNLLGTWGGSAPFGPIQTTPGEVLVIVGVGLTAGATYQVALIGAESDEWSVPWEWPSASSNPSATIPALPGQQAFGVGTSTFQVPLGVSSIVVDLAGASGAGNGLFVGGGGGRVQATIPVAAGDVLTVNVASLFSGGESSITDATTATTLAIAGGGGDAGVNFSLFHPNGGGNGGGLIALPGIAGGLTNTAGGGGTQAAGGAAGAGTGGGTNGTAGSSGAGGPGGTGTAPGGKGGDGFFGGGGGGAMSGANSIGAGGGGGSSFTVVGATGVVHTQGYQRGTGYCTIYWA